MIDRKCKVTLGGLPQKIHVKGDETKPVLLFLHGGPGVCNRHTVMTVHADLQKEFLVVAWDQRGSGGSYRGAAVETLTIDRLVDDAHELVLWLCREYGRKKVYLLGGSWGSELGTWLAYRYPEHIAAFVGFGQVVNGAKNEELSYQFALDEAQKAGDEKSIAVLKRVGPPVMGVYKGGFDGDDGPAPGDDEIRRLFPKRKETQLFPFHGDPHAVLRRIQHSGPDRRGQRVPLCAYSHVARRGSNGLSQHLYKIPGALFYL